jgi:hypothetical protein
VHTALRDRLHCLPAALVLASAATVQLRGGVEATPLPLREIAAFLFGHDTETAARLIVGSEIAAATTILACGRRGLAIAGAVVTAFVALACVSAALRSPEVARALIWPALALAGGVGSAFLAVRSGKTSPPTVAARVDGALPRRGLSPAWTALGAIGVAAITGRLAVAAQFRDPAAEAAPQKAGAMAIDLDMRPYIGSPLAESPIGTYLPRVVAQIGNDTAFIVFYNPACDACHTLFESSFSQPRLERVVAIEIPLADNATSAAAAEYHGPIECPSCEFDMLPPGPLWLVAPPMTVKVERGVVTCVADRFGGDCVNPQE